MYHAFGRSAALVLATATAVLALTPHAAAAPIPPIIKETHFDRVPEYFCNATTAVTRMVPLGLLSTPSAPGCGVPAEEPEVESSAAEAVPADTPPR